MENDDSFARSRRPYPEEPVVWRLDVSDGLVHEMGDEWSEAVQFRFIRLDDGRLDMLVRRVEARPESGSVSGTV